jgi:glyoxalase family protein
MDTLINGLHHVTALASDPQQNVDFYTGILGLRLVKRTVNFDAPEVYHLYYGNADGSPGTIMTFFPYVGLPRGKQGAGQTSFTAFSIPEGSVQYWLDRLTGHGVEHRGPEDRFAETVITLYDNDGLGLELAAASGDTRQPWENGAIPPEHAVRGFHSITLLEEGYERTAELLTGLMDHRLLVEAGNRFRYASGADRPGHLVDIVCSPESRRGLQGAGTVHHVAFATPSDEDQRTVRGRIARAGFNVTPVIDRNYFHSIYFREPGSVLFEVATVPPGFAVDEPVATLGSALKLPAQYERYRAELERTLPPLAVRRVD